MKHIRVAPGFDMEQILPLPHQASAPGRALTAASANEAHEAIEIHTFASVAEIRALRGFRDLNSVNTKNYRRIVGDYDLAEKLRCCMQTKGGGLCSTKHNFGFVAELRDGTLTVLGNCCARDKFDAEARIRSDRRRYLNEKRRREKRERLTQLIAESASRVAALGEAQAAHAALCERVAGLTAQLGWTVLRRLQEMARSDTSNVLVQAIYLKAYVDDGGHPQQERQSITTPVANLHGLRFLSKERRQAVLSPIKQAMRAFAQAKALGEQVNESVLAALVSDIAAGEQARRELDALLGEERLFLSQDLTPLLFLAAGRTERYSLARYLMERQDLPVSKEKAKVWLAEQEAALRRQLKADTIRLL